MIVFLPALHTNVVHITFGCNAFDKMWANHKLSTAPGLLRVKPTVNLRMNVFPYLYYSLI